MIAALQSIAGAGLPGNIATIEVNAPAMAPQQDFGSVLSAAARNVADNLQRAEMVSGAGITGNVDTREVVDAVMAAEHSLQTAIAVRDKVVSAWLDVSRMQI